MAGVSSNVRRWDGRAWLVRATLTTLVVIGVAVVAPRDVVTVGLVAGGAWLPAIAIGERVRLRWPGTLPTTASLLADATACAAMAMLVPDATFLLVAAVLPSAVLHALDATTTGRWLITAVTVAAQAVMLAGAPQLLLATAIADVAVLLVVATLISDGAKYRRLSDARLDHADQLTDAVLAGIGEAVVVTGTRGAIVSANDAAEVTFGGPVAGTCQDTLGLVRGAGKLDCSHGCPLLGPGGASAQSDVARDHPSGRRQALLANVRTIRDPLGRVREVVHSYRDVTRIKEAEQAKTLFLATASHELKTPVAVIAGFASTLSKHTLGEEQSKLALETIVSRSRQLTTIVDRLLLASRIDGGGFAITSEPMDVIAPVRERVVALRQVTERDITLAVPDQLPEALAHHTALVTVVDHLVENAVKYSPGGGPIDVTVRATAATIEIDVTDAGVGMSSHDVEHCFEAFWQAEPGDDRRFGGSGVGLYIVRSMARAMGGDVTVPSTAPGHGTTFRVGLRRADLPTPAEPQPRAETGTMIDEFMRQVGVGPAARPDRDGGTR